jgi:DNA polymerase-3 subunit chi
MNQPMDCQVDFYVLAASAPSAEHLACRLSLMAWEQGHRVAVLASGETAAEALDELMWDYPAARFLPHARLPDAAHDEAGRDAAAPVAIVSSADRLGADRAVVVNLSGETVPDPLRFRRLLEIVPAEPRMREASRVKYREYRKLGLQPTSHDIDNF